MKIKIFNCVLILTFAFTFCSCVSFQVHQKDAESPKIEKSETDDFNFTEKSIQTSISQIRHSLKNDSLKALWRSYVLLSSFSQDSDKTEIKAEVEELFSECFTNEKNTMEQLVKDENTIEIYSHYNTVSKILLDCKKLSGFENESFSSFIDEFSEQAKLCENKIFSENVAYVSGLSNSATPANSANPTNKKSQNKISTAIDGTVTVWVDLGVKLVNGRAFSNKAIGSAFFIDERGYLITNYHVISSEVDPKYEGVSRLYIKTSSNSEVKVPAKVIGYDSLLDIALLKTEISPKYVFSLASSQDLEVGDEIYAIGSPVGLERTLTRGIVSATDRQLFSIATVLQIDAALNQGNSGGPIVDSNLNVQGISFAGLLNYENLNFAIPVEYLKFDLPYLYCGEVKHSYIGAYGKTKKDEAGNNLGVEVLWLEKNGNASKALLKVGDTITAVNGKTIKTLEQLHNAFVQIRPHSIVCLQVKNSLGEVSQIDVYTDNRSKSPLLDIFKNETISSSFLPLFGLELKRASSVSKSKFTVQSVVQGSIADESGFSELDPIQILKTGVQTVQDTTYIYSEVYSKKKLNGYLDAVMFLACPTDSENVF